MKLPNFKYALVLIAVGFSGISSYSQDQTEAVKNKQRVNYIYNFTKYITWENLEHQNEFTIALLGEKDEALFQEFSQTAATKQIKGLDVRIKSIQSKSEIENLDILYIYKNFDIDLDPVLEKMYTNNALLVTEGFPFHESMINFIEIDEDFQFEINEDKINRATLLIDPALKEFSIQSTVDWDKLYNRLQKEIATVQDQQEELQKLALKIEQQKKNIEAQEQKLNETLEDLRNKNSLVRQRDIEIQKQQTEIQKQLKKLERLLADIDVQTEANEKLKQTYEDQLNNVNLQAGKLSEQEDLLSENVAEIEGQKSRISEQNKILGEQLTQLEQQQLISWISIIFGVLAIVFIVFMFRSNKRRRKSEQSLQQKNQQLIELNDSLDSFTYRVSHDLKAPIVNMKTMIGMLNEYSDKDANPILPELFENLDMSTDRLENTVTDMLELTRIQRVEEAKSEVNIQTIFDDLIAQYRGELDKIGAEVKVNLDQKLIFASQVELNSIFQNMFTNSIKYRTKETPLIISIASSLNKNQCNLVYKDNGQGIDLKRHEKKLFNMFQRFTADSSIEGTGVGMYIIKKLISKNNGDVKIESEPLKGLTYIINFPVTSK